MKLNEQNEMELIETDKRKQNETECSEINSSCYNIYTASGVAQDKKVRVRTLGRKNRLENKLHYILQADRNWKPINAFASVWGGKWGQRTVEEIGEVITWGKL